jgi:hypothetical protein
LDVDFVQGNWNWNGVGVVVHWVNINEKAFIKNQGVQFSNFLLDTKKIQKVGNICSP